MKKFIINYKAYTEAIDKGLEIASAASKISEDTGVDIIVAPPFTLIKEIAKTTKTITQGLDEVEPGAFTAHVTWYEIKKSGAVGTLLNHSERRYSYSKGGPIAYQELKKAVDFCRQNGLETYVCVQNIEEAEKVLKFRPTSIAYEPPELIGGNVSVSSARPDIVKEFCDLVKAQAGVLPLIGAGIKTAEDVKKSVELGSEGILVASGVMKSNDFRSAIIDLATPLR
ncbi:MAG: triose-phosphate isomerase [Candidatus Parvarchaeota archaeon]|nr:triose-phosphate isomerase [Candidatus Parvarchaeota archaeon]